MSDSPPGAACCGWHNRHCEPPGDLCCRACTEARHVGPTYPDRPYHPDGSLCVTPDLSAGCAAHDLAACTRDPGCAINGCALLYLSAAAGGHRID